MGVILLWLWIFTWLFEFNEQRFTSWQPEDPVWPGGVAKHLQLGTLDAKVVPNQLAGIVLNFFFWSHNRLNSSTACNACVLASSKAL